MEFKPALAEAIGTFALTFVGAGAVIFASNDLASGLVGVAFAHGLILAAMIAIFGALSGGHFNPAVTIGMWLSGRVEPAKAGLFMAAQFAGAILAAALLKIAVPVPLADAAHLGTPAVGHLFGAGAAQAVVGEAVLAFLFIITIFAVTSDQAGSGSLAPLVIGIALTACILGGGPLSGAALNPARWFGPALISGSFTDGWVYIVGPIAGGVAAALTWALVFGNARTSNTLGR